MSLSAEVACLIDTLIEPDVILSTLKDNLIITDQVTTMLALIEFNCIQKLCKETLPAFIACFEADYRKVEKAGEFILEKHHTYKLIQS